MELKDLRTLYNLLDRQISYFHHNPKKVKTATIQRIKLLPLERSKDPTVIARLHLDNGEVIYSHARNIWLS